MKQLAHQSDGAKRVTRTRGGKLRNRKQPANQYQLAKHRFRSAGLRKCCAPIALMILLELPFEVAVSACSVLGKYKGCRGGTRKTHKVLGSLGMTLTKIRWPQSGLDIGGQLRDLEQALRDGALPRGKFLVRSRRFDPERDRVGHASAIVDGQLFDGKANIGNSFDIRAVYRVEGDIEQARLKAERVARTIKKTQQPVAQGKLAEFCRIFGRHHGLANTVAVEFRHASGRKKRSDTVVKWFPLKLARQQRAWPNSNVSSLIRTIHDLLETDLAAARPCLADRRGTRIHGNTQAASVLR